MARDRMAFSDVELAQRIHRAARLALEGRRSMASREWTRDDLPPGVAELLEAIEDAGYEAVQRANAAHYGDRREMLREMAREAAQSDEVRAFVAEHVLVDGRTRERPTHVARIGAPRTLCGKTYHADTKPAPIDTAHWGVVDDVACEVCRRPFVARGVLFGLGYRSGSRGGRDNSGFHWLELVGPRCGGCGRRLISGKAHGDLCLVCEAHRQTAAD